MARKTIYPERKDNNVSGLTLLEKEMYERLRLLKEALLEAESNHHTEEGNSSTEATIALRETVREALRELTDLMYMMNAEENARSGKK